MSVATQKSTAPRTTKKSEAGDGSATAKKRASKKPAAKSSAAPKRETSRPSRQKSSSASEVAHQAAAQLADLTGKEVEGVTSLERTDDGWTVELDVVELRRIPSTTDVLATYEVDVDGNGELQGYRRAQRYVRGVAGEE